MPVPQIHITGAAGAGVSTLGRALAARLGAVHLDTDDFYWLPVEPKFTGKRDPAERVALLRQAIADSGNRGFVLSGSVGPWGDPLVPYFRHVIFLTTPTEIRLARLRDRETREFGAAALAPGGARHEEYRAFIEWAAGYDAGTDAGRSRRKHEAWLKELSCPILRLDGSEAVQGLTEQSLAWLDRS